MAGETPNAHNVNRRRKLAWNDDRSTNKVYASGDISALGDYTTAADSTLKPGQTPVPIPTPTVRHDDQSADKYYANDGSKRVRGPQVAAGQKKLGPPPPLGVTPRKRPPTADPKTQCTVNNQDEINGVVHNVIERVRNGEPGVLFVKKGDNQLLRRVRACLDLLVAREVITEDQYRDIRLSYELDTVQQSAVADKLGVPTASVTVRTEDNENSTVDPLEFLNSADDDDGGDLIDTSPTAVTEVDASNDVMSSPAPSYPSAGDDLPETDDDGNDFFAPKSEEEPVRGEAANAVLIDEAATGIEPDPVAADGYTGSSGTPGATGDPEAAPKRRGKRSGRGVE